MSSAAPAHPLVWRAPPLFGSLLRQRLALAALIAYLMWAVSDLDVDVNRVLAGDGVSPGR